MFTSMIAPLAIVAAEAEESAPPIPAWLVGVIAFGILMGLLAALLAFGGGREHS